MITLNLGAGKIKPILFESDSKDPQLLINLDTSYYSYDKPDFIEDVVSSWNHHGSKIDMEHFCNEDAFTFMERTQVVFDRVCAYRFLEHIPMDRVLYFIYLLSTVTKKGGFVDIIVPDYEILAGMIMDDKPGGKDFEAHNIILTTELLNQPPDPHATVWTPDRMKYFWELEGRFKLKKINNNFDFDGRDIYIRAILERI